MLTGKRSESLSVEEDIVAGISIFPRLATRDPMTAKNSGPSLNQNKRRMGDHHSRLADAPKPLEQYLRVVEIEWDLRLVEAG